MTQKLTDQNVQIVVGVSQIDLEPWKTICNSGQKPTWMSSFPKEIQLINLYGRKPNAILKKIDETHEFLRLRPWGNGITNRLDFLISQALRLRNIPNWEMTSEGNYLRMDAKVSSTYVTQVIREFSLFSYFLESTNAKFLYMTNTSSYVNLENLLNLSKNFASHSLQGGSIVKFDKFNFYSGANRLFSRDVVKELVENFKNIDYRLLNDVAIGKILSSFKLNHSDIPSMTFSSLDEISKSDKQQIRDSVHFRLKSGTLQDRNDVNLMNAVHKIINS